MSRESRNSEREHQQRVGNEQQESWVAVVRRGQGKQSKAKKPQTELGQAGAANGIKSLARPGSANWPEILQWEEGEAPTQSQHNSNDDNLLTKTLRTIISGRDLGESRELWERSGRDLGEIWERSGGIWDLGKIWERSGRDLAGIWGRSGEI